MPDVKSMEGTKIVATPVKQTDIGIDTNNELQNDILDAALTSTLDMSKLEGFLNVAQTREQT